jgi:hypothetical protein
MSETSSFNVHNNLYLIIFFINPCLYDQDKS